MAPTMRLRWFRLEWTDPSYSNGLMVHRVEGQFRRDYKLQQWFADDLGHGEWRDVPAEYIESPPHASAP